MAEDFVVHERSGPVLLGYVEDATDESRRVSDVQPLPTSVGGTAGTDLTAIRTAVQVMDDWDESDRAKVNLIVGQAGIAAGAGAVGVTVPRMTMASDSPDVASLATIVTQTAPLVPGGNLVDTTGTAGTPEQINAGNSQACRGVMLSNWSSSAIAAGFSNAVDVTLKTGCTIGAGKSMFFPCTNTNQIWVDVTTSGDAYGGVYYT